MDTPLYDDKWKRTGVSLLWDAESLVQVATHKQVISLHKFVRMAETGWPEELPCLNGDVIVVGGLDACIDVFSPVDAVAWLEQRLYYIILSFQQEYENQAALIFWMPDGLNRLDYKNSDDIYNWICAGEHRNQLIPLSRGLWNGAAQDARRIIAINGSRKGRKEDWVGLYHPRIS